MLYFDFGSHILIYRNIIFELLLVSSLLLVKDKICFVCFKMSRYRKRFSKKGFEKLENNFQIVEELLKSSSRKVKKLENELKDLQNHQKNIVKETRENKDLQNLTEFYNQRKSLCDRDISRLKMEKSIAEQEWIGFGICFRRCYYLMYGKPSPSDLK
jgi:Skp family chaperone for outer membrane proteins